MPGFNAAQFCGELYVAACDHAKGRIGQPPKSGQLQMVDFFRAFSRLKSEQYNQHFGPVAGEWNEAMAMIKAYTTAFVQKKIPTPVAEAISKAIHSWVYYSKLPKTTRDELTRMHQELCEFPSKLHQRITHFFRELELHATHLPPSEHTMLMQTTLPFKLQLDDTCTKKETAAVDSLLTQFESTIEKLVTQASSREMKNLFSKTQHELSGIRSLLHGNNVAS